MRHFCLLSFSVCFLFSSLIPSINSNLIMPYSNDFVNSTCQQCSDISSIFDYNFCVTSIQAVTVSRSVDLQGLAIVVMELALENATSTITTIEKLIISKPYDAQSIKCLRQCLEAYEDAISNAVMAMGAVATNNFAAANMFMSSVVEEPMNCEAGYRHKKGQLSPLAKQNYDLFEIGIISLCIINQASLQPSLN